MLHGRRGVFDATFTGDVYFVDAITNNPGAAGGVITTLNHHLDPSGLPVGNGGAVALAPVTNATPAPSHGNGNGKGKKATPTPTPSYPVLPTPPPIFSPTPSPTPGPTPTPAAPTATFSYSPSSPLTGQAVSFNGSGSTCADGPCTYVWTDDGCASPCGDLGSGVTLAFTFAGAGTKYVRLTVVDALYRSATVEHDVVLSAPADAGAHCHAGADTDADSNPGAGNGRKLVCIAQRFERGRPQLGDRLE